MKIAYFLSWGAGPSPYNGVRVQAETWAEELRRKGHDVSLVGAWDRGNWEDFDVLHVFMANPGTLDLVRTFWRRNSNIVFSPIIDTEKSVFAYKLACIAGINRLNIGTYQYFTRLARPYIKKWIVRSDFEASYVHGSYGVSHNQIRKVPLSFRTCTPVQLSDKQDFCLHVSKITDSRKNVMRLMEASVKYGFRLVLAGGISGEESFKSMKEFINAHSNIEYLGRVNDDKLVELYTKAKVFALPSTCEGVGLVALEAAACGCNIVITNIGGPKEYYDDMAFKVDPYSVDAIGNAVKAAMVDHSKQPVLMKYIKEQYNLSICVDKLIDIYNECKQKI